MSIQNDVEKLYRSDLEKQRQKQKKKKKKKLLGIMLIVIIIAALILIMQYLGLRIGGGFFVGFCVGFVVEKAKAQGTART